MIKVNRSPSVFFVTGVPKSGTTWVQMMLNSHQHIFCRPEDKFSTSLNAISQLLEGYNRLIDKTNKKTANQKELYFFNETDRISCFKWLITQALLKYSQVNKPISHIGSKDNGIMNNAAMYVQSFPKAKYIGIVRNPKDVAVSSWFHNLRVEQGFQNRSGGSLAAWAEKLALAWGTSIKNLSSAFNNRPNQLLWVRYEDLLYDTTDTVKSILDFLSVTSDPSEIQKIIEENQFSKLSNGRKQGSEDQNNFFRKGISGDWKNHLSPEAWDEATHNIKDLMNLFLYE